LRHETGDGDVRALDVDAAATLDRVDVQRGDARFD
jgi:hypothetical protein